MRRPPSPPLLAASLLFLAACPMRTQASPTVGSPRRRPDFFSPSSSPPPPATGGCSSADATNRACSFFLWDVASMIRYSICHRLLRQSVYEGRGGKKMVRIRPGSVLDYLYPLSKHAPDRCCLCGSTFEGHLNRWWVRRGKAGSPYDRMLDEISRDGIRGAYLGDGGGREGKGRQASRSFGMPNAPLAILSFHRQYVEEPSNENAGGRGPALRSVRTRKPSEKDSRRFEFRTGATPINYRVPRFTPDGMGWKTNIILLARVLVLDEFDSFLCLQDRENRRLERNVGP